MELTFPTVAHIMLCSAILIKTALVPHCSAYCWAMPAQYQDSHQPPTKASRQEVGKGNCQGRWPKPTKGMFQGKRKEGGICPPIQPLHVLRPCFPGYGWTLFVDGKQRIYIYFFSMFLHGLCLFFPLPFKGKDKVKCKGKGKDWVNSVQQ